MNGIIFKLIVGEPTLLVELNFAKELTFFVEILERENQAILKISSSSTIKLNHFSHKLHNQKKKTFLSLSLSLSC